MKTLVFDKFYEGLYGRSWKIYSKHRRLSKVVNFFKLEANLMKKVFFQFPAGEGVSVQIFVLRPCAIAKLQILGHSRSSVIQNLSQVLLTCVLSQS